MAATAELVDLMRIHGKSERDAYSHMYQDQVLGSMV
jgi:hypothetical protein